MAQEVFELDLSHFLKTGRERGEHLMRYVLDRHGFDNMLVYYKQTTFDPGWGITLNALALSSSKFSSGYTIVNERQ